MRGARGGHEGFSMGDSDAKGIDFGAGMWYYDRMPSRAGWFGEGDLHSAAFKSGRMSGRIETCGDNSTVQRSIAGPND